jgi:hypothetical protein
MPLSFAVLIVGTGSGVLDTTVALTEGGGVSVGCGRATLSA